MNVQLTSNTVEYCEPCIKLDGALQMKVEEIDGTPVCKHCANAVRFMKMQEKDEQAKELQNMIRLGKVPF